MGLRCLIGHDYGEPQTSRDRTQRGNEVVVTVREYRECTRCGHTRVISENKEIKADTSTATEDEPAAEAAWSADADRADDQATVDAFARSTSASSGFDHEESVTAAEDDGIILEDEPEEAPPRAHGEWPEADLGEDADAPADDHGPWPDEAATPAPEEPEPPAPGEDPLDVGPEPTAESAADDEGQTEIMEADDAPAEPDDRAGKPDESRPPRPDNRDTEFVCPDCGETWPTRNASLRPGDICPACKRGYLEERVVQ